MVTYTTPGVSLGRQAQVGREVGLRVGWEYVTIYTKKKKKKIIH